MNSDTRFVTFLVAAVAAYMAIEYIIERRAAFARWRVDFMAPFEKHPGRVEFLRRVLTEEEMKDTGDGS